MFDLAARVVLAPLLFRQARDVRRKALHLPDATGPLAGQAGQGPDLRLLIVGDSSAAGVGTSHHDEALLGHMCKRLSQTNRVTYSVLAKTGATTAQMTARVAAAPRGRCDVVSVSLGINDICALVSRRKWCRQYRALLDLLDEKYDHPLICVSGLPPLQHFPLLPRPLNWVMGQEAARFDRALRRIAASRPNCRFVAMDFAPDVSLMSVDGFHPGPRIYAQWGGRVYRAIRRDVKTLHAAPPLRLAQR